MTERNFRCKHAGYKVTLLVYLLHKPQQNNGNGGNGGNGGMAEWSDGGEDRMFNWHKRGYIRTIYGTHRLGCLLLFSVTNIFPPKLVMEQ
jgi:hypothetical protein